MTYKRTHILTAGCQVAYQIDDGPIELLYDEKNTDSKTVSKFLDAQFLVRSVRPNPAIFLAHNSTLSKESLARHNLIGVVIKTFTFSVG